MLKFFLFISFISFSALARDCQNEYRNLTAGLSLTYMINDLSEQYGTEALSACDNKTKVEHWKDTQKSSYEAFINSKGVDFCKEVKKRIKAEVGCHLDKSYLDELKKTDFRKVNFAQYCRSHLPVLKSRYEKYCLKKNAPAKTGAKSLN